MHPNLTEPTEKDCAEATMTQTARDEGVKCGFYELVFTFENTDEKDTLLYDSRCDVFGFG